MTNKEFYFDKLLAVALANACGTFHRVVHGENCAEKDCEDCEFYTAERIENWLNAEHVEPEPTLLENGDGLKPGDWIMVRDGEGAAWDKWQLLCYLDGKFYARKKHIYDNDYVVSVWQQARLPEDGE